MNINERKKWTYRIGYKIGIFFNFFLINYFLINKKHRFHKIGLIDTEAF